ncbi:MAG: outer membrane lipoprotein carrier protein LolA [Bdellovibrionales bacterium]|nr:outer membrane lipoprotein carrier protein LolA [Bdellovibrionales bacterium]
MKQALLSLLLVPGAALALPPEAKAPQISLPRLQSTYKEALTVKADFVQEVYQATLARTKTSTGGVYLKKPNLFRWDVLEPEKSLTVSDGRKLRYFTPNAGVQGKGQVIVRPVRDLTRQPLYRILMGSSSLKAEFHVEKTERVNGIVAGEKETRLTLLPRKDAHWREIDEITLTVDAKYLISEINILHSSGNKTRIRLQNQTLGSKLPPKLFQFSAPQGAEVIHQ